MNRNDIPKTDIHQFLAAGEEEWLRDGFFITNNIYPYLQDHPVRLSFYAIALCNGGLYRTQINLREYALTANSFMAFKPYQTVNLLEIKDYTGMLVVFNKEFFQDSNTGLHLLEQLAFFNDKALPMVSFAETDARLLMDEFIQLRHKAARKDHLYRKEIVRNLLQNLLYEADALYRKQYSHFQKHLSRKEELAMQFHDVLMQHFREQRGVQYYADALYISPKYLSELLRETSGRNASELIEEAVAAEACVLLKNTSSNISQIAETLHFSDASAFIKFFKKHVQLSPAAYRRGEY
ncbi:helix-turn-helix transcriptional regulator [Chitinophagaceae bacterium MMS25-I14]